MYSYDIVQAMSLQPSKPAPDFNCIAVVDGDFKDVKLSDYAGKYLVLVFYPLDFTFVCPTELLAFSNRADEFRAIGCEVVVCSTDSHFTHLAWLLYNLYCFLTSTCLRDSSFS